VLPALSADASRPPPLDSGWVLALLGEASVVKNYHRIALAGKREHLVDALGVQILCVPDDVGQEILQLLLAGSGGTTWDIVLQFLREHSVRSPLTYRSTGRSSCS